jgi:hypothetical protein
MIMIIHEAECMKECAEPFVGLPQAIQEEVAVLVGMEDRLFPVAARAHMIECPGELDPPRAGHGKSLSVFLHR